MIRKKIQFHENNDSPKIEVSIRQISKKNLNNSADLKEGEICKNYSGEINEKYINKQLRGRQLYPNINPISKKNNSSLATTCESKKRNAKKKELIKDIKNNTFPQRGNYFYGDDISPYSISDKSNKNRRRNLKDKKNNNTESNKRINRNLLNNFPEILNESNELDLSNENNNKKSTEDIIYDDNNDENVENIDIDNLTIEIQKILIDVYNSHINPEKAKNRNNNFTYYKYIEGICFNLDRHYNIFILQILSEKIKELVKKYKEKIMEIEEIKSIKMRYQEIIEKNLCNNTNGNNIPIVFFKSKNNKNSFRKYDSKNILLNKEKENILNIKKDFILPFTEKTWETLHTLLRELTNIKIALISSSSDIEKIFKIPLSNLKINDKIVTFSIQDMHKEEFYSTLLEDEFINYLIKQVREKATENKLDQILTLIENLEYDCFINNNDDTFNKINNNFNKNNNELSSNNTNQTNNTYINREMTRFSLFLKNQLNEIIEQQKALERQFQSIKANNNIDDLKNLNQLINLKKDAAKFYFNNQNNFTSCVNNSNNINNNSNSNSNSMCVSQENINTSNNSINISSISNNILSENSNHNNFQMSNNMHFSQSFNKNNDNVISKNLNLPNPNLTQNNLSFNFINNKNNNINNINLNNNNNLNINNTPKNYSNSICKNNKIKLNCQNCCGAVTPNSNYNIVNTSNKINFSCNTTNININNSNTNINNPTTDNPTTDNPTIDNPNISNSNTNNVKNEKFNDIDALVAYINTNEESKIKKNKKKSTKKKNQQQKVLQIVNNNGIYDELVVENFRKNIYKDSCFAENIRKIKPIFSIDWIKSINSIVQ